MLSGIPGIEDIAMTTNGMFLAGKAAALKQAGLNRVNISLDSLRQDRFAMITRGEKSGGCWKGCRRPLNSASTPSN